MNDKDGHQEVDFEMRLGFKSSFHALNKRLDSCQPSFPYL